MTDKFTLHHGDCLEVIKTLPDNSVDAIVTDPPYGLAFMGKKWDYDVPSEDVWRECLRVLKPGGHLLAFAGTRTQHRMCVRIEDAGFEIRDMIAWVYGSGFPKSLDVSKAIDKMDASEEQHLRRLRFTGWVRSTGINATQIDILTGTRMGGHYTSAASQPAIMTREHLEACRLFLGDIPEWVERECDIRSVESKNFSEREVVGQMEMTDTSKARAGFSGKTHSPDYDGSKRIVNITAPATEAAKQWQGWGTALKPAMEPITVARKPLEGTVAANVLKHGTGALNIDRCRVETPDGKPAWHYPNGPGGNVGQEIFSGLNSIRTEYTAPSTGRWPANFIHSGESEVEVLLGDAARFFYCAKASKRDRNDGCEGLGLKKAGSLNMRTDSHSIANGMDTAEARNHHPTVKPVDLMTYLCRLITPPNGIVLDPFTGSGSTGKAAILEDFRFIGIEREAEYIEIARARIQEAVDYRKGFLF